ncbi:MAG: hypothetical protein ACJA1F_002984, partial [Paracoccaceae bacterium]
GFRATYFDFGDIKKDPADADWTRPGDHQEIITEIEYEKTKEPFWEGGPEEKFGVKIDGNIEVEQAGTFTFHVDSDKDAAVLFINGVEASEYHDGKGGKKGEFEIELDAGTHVFELRYFDEKGNAELKLEWEGPGIDGRALVTAPPVDDLQTVSGRPIVFGLENEDTSMLVEDRSITGLPEGTVVQAGAASVEVGQDGVAQITGWDTSLLVISAPVNFYGQVAAKLVTTVQAENGDTVAHSTDVPFSVQSLFDTPPSLQVETGFRARYFDMDQSLRKLSDVDWSAPPTHQETVSEINYTNSGGSFWEGGSTDTFGTQLTGNINVEEGGEFTFYLGGDDGAALYIDGNPVVVDDGLHGYRTRNDRIELDAGTYDIEVRYFENYGNAGLKLEWEGPGIDGRELVPAHSGLVTPQNGTAELCLTASELGEAGQISMSGLPADTILISGDNFAMSDGGPVDLTGWDLGSLEMSPPLGFVGTITAEVTLSDTAFTGQTIETVEVFSIDVGDVEAMQSEIASAQHAILFEESSAGAGSTSWLEAADGEGQGSTSSDDDNVLQEPVNEGGDTDTAMAFADTYERQDW